VSKIVDLGTLEALSGGEINGIRMLPYGSNAVFEAILEVPSGDLRAIYKPRAGEAPLWDFPDGTLYQREYAAYLLSREAGWDLIPPTVIRDGPHGIGTMQLFIEHDEQATFFSLREERLAEFAAVAAFDSFTNNADRKGGDVLEDPDQRLWFIDHGLMFHTDYKLRTVIWEFQGEPIPDEIVERLRATATVIEPGAELEWRLRELLAVEEVETLRARLSALLKEPVYPWPGPHRSVPWPPV
jgi:uncharacterized repeat protein (TIGR03843 family)